MRNLIEGYAGLPAADRGADPLSNALTVVGAREIVLAAIVIVLVKSGVPEVATVSIRLAALIGVADFAIVFALRGAELALNFASHTSGMVLRGATWLSLRNSRR